MNLMEIEEIINLFEELKEYLSKYVDDSIDVSYKYLCNMIEVIKVNDSENIEDEILRTYKSLYPGIGGLSDFYIWDDNYEKRCLLNEPLERIHKKLWDLLKSYL